MQISTYLPTVLQILDTTPALKESLAPRSLQCAYLCVGRINDAKGLNTGESYHAIPAELFDELPEGTVVSYELIGKLMHVSNKKVREIINDLITQVAIQHLISLQKSAPSE
jgi:hypothetical protein